MPSSVGTQRRNLISRTAPSSLPARQAGSASPPRISSRARGAQLCLIGRDAARTDAARQSLLDATPDARVQTVVADLASLDAVRSAAARIGGLVPGVDVLIHNAGALVHERRMTVDDLELTAQVHVVAPFLLTTLLLPLLRASADARVIFVSSGGMYTRRLDVDALEHPPEPFDGVRAYANAKRAQVVLTDLWARHPAGRGISFHAMHPGWADTPGVQESLPGFRRVMHPLLRSAEQGADTMAWLAAAPEARAIERRVLARSPAPSNHRVSLDAYARRRSGTALELVRRSFRRPPRDRGVVRIAIVGTGVSGLVAAHALHGDHDVTIYEADGRVGGHAHTVDVEVGGITHAVDTGFIVYNEANYPGFTALLRELGVETQPTEMSFSVTDAGSGLEYRGSNLNTLFAQRRNLRRPSFLRLLGDIVRFNRAARRLVMNEARWQGADRLPAAGGDDGTGDESIESFLRRGRYSRSFVEQFLVPFGSAIWSADPSTFTQFPMRSYARFMHNHGLLGLPGRTQWRTISGGSRQYVDRLVAPFADRIRLGTAVHKVVADTV